MIHALKVRLVFMNIELTIQMIHAPGIKENQHQEDINRTLLGEPETELETRDLDMIQLIDQQDAETVGHYKPDTQTGQKQAQIRLPVRTHFLIELHWASPLLIM
jgi:hypothetical protein